MTRRQIGGLALCVLLSSCAVGPNYERPHSDVPKDWTADHAGGETGATPEIAAWWTALNDPVLNDLVAQAVAKNFDLRVAESRVREARAARGVVASGLWPDVGASAAYARRQSIKPETPSGSPVGVSFGTNPAGPFRSTTVNTPLGAITSTVTNEATGAKHDFAVSLPGHKTSTPDRQTDLFQAGFDAAWELDVFGGTRRAVEAAEDEVQAAEEARRGVLVSLAAEVTLNYIELRSAQSRLDIANKNITAQSNSVTLTKSRFDAGLTSQLDTVRAHALLSKTQSQVPFFTQQIAESTHRLAVLLGLNPGDLNAQLSAAGPLPAAPAEVPVGLPSDLLERRPDIRTAERQLAAATARIGQAKADFFPKFLLTGSLGSQSSDVTDLLNGSRRIWSFGPSIDWPIFQGGRIRANVKVQQAREEQAAITYEKNIKQALADVENGLVAFAQEQARRKSLDTAVSDNEHAVDLANQRYTSGLETFVNVLLAEQSLYEAQDQCVQSQTNVLIDLIGLYKALGGGWNTPAEATTTIPRQN